MIAPPWREPYNSVMTEATHDAASAADWRCHAFDLVRGLAAYTSSPLVAGLAQVIDKHPEADVGNAFNHKQVACKMWAREMLLSTAGGAFREIWIVGGWYGVLAAMLLEDSRFSIDRITNSDIDPSVAEVALTLNRAFADRFIAMTADMYGLDYGERRPDLVVNTSCEHIPNLRAWLGLLPAGTRVLLQSNDYFAEPTHIACVPSLEAFVDQAGLTDVDYAGSLKQRNYTRFMLIGRI
jgi:hypothetical protein